MKCQVCGRDKTGLRHHNARVRGHVVSFVVCDDCRDNRSRAIATVKQRQGVDVPHVKAFHHEEEP